jgi:cellulose synthase/poly-beta-1,6-N-acetylglucosamine synthase-like glycosyltransferase
MDSPSVPEPTVSVTVSVVVPVLNGAATIDQCIRSILGLDFPPAQLEVIVVDNGSTDSTRDLLERYRDRIRVLSEAIRGPAAARNAGVGAARGQWIAFTDADCIVDPKWLRHLLPPLEDDTVGITGGTILAARPCNRIELFGEKIHDHRLAIEGLVPPYAITMNWASRRAVLMEAGLFDQDLLRGEDGDLAYRVHQRGYRLVFCPEALVFHKNESTLGGLFREGVAHGMAGTLIQAKAIHRLPPARWVYPVRRMAGAARRLILGGGSRLEALCALTFDLGKAAGRLRTERRLGREHRGRGPTAAPESGQARSR